MSAATPKTVKTRSGNRKAVEGPANVFSVIHARFEAPRLGTIRIDEGSGEPWYYSESSLYHAAHLRDIVYLLDRVGRKVK